jgi:hypothetical protein
VHVQHTATTPAPQHTCAAALWLHQQLHPVELQAAELSKGGWKVEKFRCVSPVVALQADAVYVLAMRTEVHINKAVHLLLIF